MKRKKLNNRKSRKMFSATADRTHVLNMGKRPMRGGTRL